MKKDKKKEQQKSVMKNTDEGILKEMSKVGAKKKKIDGKT